MNLYLPSPGQLIQQRVRCESIRIDRAEVQRLSSGSPVVRSAKEGKVRRCNSCTCAAPRALRPEIEGRGRRPPCVSSRPRLNSARSSGCSSWWQPEISKELAGEDVATAAKDFLGEGVVGGGRKERACHRQREERRRGDRGSRGSGEGAWRRSSGGRDLNLARDTLKNLHETAAKLAKPSRRIRMRD